MYFLFVLSGAVTPISVFGKNTTLLQLYLPQVMKSY